MYSVDILINDKPVRKIPFQDKIFIEARHGQEYSIRVKNNAWQRILGVFSVDGLDALNGKPADENGNGYVINGYNSLNLEGFRVSNEKIAKFVFATKEASYAAEKGDGSEKNVGVIGVRIFNEKYQLPFHILTQQQHRRTLFETDPFSPTIWCDNTYRSTCGTSGTLEGTSESLGASNNSEQYCCDDIPRSTKMSAKGSNSAKSHTSGIRRAICHTITDSGLVAHNMMRSAEPTFDMGTKWGDSKTSKVIEVEFEKGILALTSNIYYASRENLIAMGVPMENEKQVSFPEPFVDKYAKPPKNWKG